MGKPNPAKLANFPEVEVFVLVADPDGLLLDSKVLLLGPFLQPNDILSQLPRGGFVMFYQSTGVL